MHMVAKLSTYKSLLQKRICTPKENPLHCLHGGDWEEEGGHQQLALQCMMTTMTNDHDDEDIDDDNDNNGDEDVKNH